MNEHQHSGRRRSLEASVLCLSIGAMQFVGGRIEGSVALEAGMIENVGDAAGYGMNAAPQAEWKREIRIRRWAGRIVCFGALVVGGNAVEELARGEVDPVGRTAPIIATIAAAGAYGVHRRLSPHQHDKSGHGDNARHARADAFCAPLAIAGTFLAANGLPEADPVSSVLISGIIVVANLPTPKRLGLEI